jgi:Haemolysin-type calcium binding protein related domain.
MSTETETVSLSFQVNDQQTDHPNYGINTYTVDGTAAFGSPHTYTAAEVQTAGITGNDRFTVTYQDAASATLSVDSAWNTIKNVRAHSDGAAEVTLRNVVNTDVALGDGGDSRVVIEGAKRGDIVTGDGNDTISIDAHSNDAGWDNTFRISTGAGDDAVFIAGDTWTGVSLDAGDGDDVIVVGIGQGEADTIIGGAGNDVLWVEVTAAQYSAALHAELQAFQAFFADPAHAGQSFTFAMLDGLTVSGIEDVALFVDGQPVDVNHPPQAADATFTTDEDTPLSGTLPGYGVYAQRYNVDGQTVGAEFRVNDTVLGNQSNPSVSARADGGFVVTWESENVDGSGYAIVEKVFSSTGESADVVFNTSGSDTLIGGGGADIYQVGRDTGTDVIDNRGHGGEGDTVSFGANVAHDQLWFQRLGDDLKISVIGTSANVTVGDWYSAGANHVDKITTADGYVLHGSQVDNLISAMAAFTPPASGQTQLTTQQHAALDVVIAANWSSHG